MISVQNEAVLTRRRAKKVANALDSIIGVMKEDDLLSISILDNTILVESDDVVTIVKLDNQ